MLELNNCNKLSEQGLEGILKVSIYIFLLG